MGEAWSPKKEARVDEEEAIKAAAAYSNVNDKSLAEGVGLDYEEIERLKKEVRENPEKFGRKNKKKRKS